MSQSQEYISIHDSTGDDSWWIAFLDELHHQL
jgi:hypothetical protein